MAEIFLKFVDKYALFIHLKSHLPNMKAMCEWQQMELKKHPNIVCVFAYSVDCN